MPALETLHLDEFKYRSTLSAKGTGTVLLLGKSEDLCGDYESNISTLSLELAAFQPGVWDTVRLPNLITFTLCHSSDQIGFSAATSDPNLPQSISEFSSMLGRSGCALHTLSLSRITAEFPDAIIDLVASLPSISTLIIGDSYTDYAEKLCPILIRLMIPASKDGFECIAPNVQCLCLDLYASGTESSAVEHDVFELLQSRMLASEPGFISVLVKVVMQIHDFSLSDDGRETALEALCARFAPLKTAGLDLAILP